MRVLVLCAALVLTGCASSERFLWEEYLGSAVGMLGAERYVRAERYLNLALGKAEMLGNEERGISLNAFGELFRRQGRFEEAEDFFKLALAAKEEALGPDHPDVAVTLTNLALTYSADGHPAEAGPLLERARDIQDGNKVSPRTRARTLVALADVYRKLGREGDATALDARVRALREGPLGEK
jgi:tetratricopeptide (TPR) repeat protein